MGSSGKGGGKRPKNEHHGAKADRAFEVDHLGKYAEIGMALSGEQSVDRLLEMIIHEAREITNADAGTLYLLNDDRTHLDFVILHNDTMNTRLGGTSGVNVELPPVPLAVDGRPNHGNVSSHVAITGEIVSIADVYESDEFDFTGPRKYDEATGYRSKSMLVFPMRNHEDDIIGVMQLLNAQDPGGKGVTEFRDDHVVLVASLASQAAAVLTKTVLIQDLQDLFYSFIKTIANAIEEKSPYTGGHIKRVVDISMRIARRINDIDEGPFAEMRFSDDELEELKLASWLHDVGKIITPEWVVDKASKLQTIYDRVELVRQRFELIAHGMEVENLKARLELMEQGADPAEVKTLEQQFTKARQELDEELAFVMSCNEPGEFMSDERIERVTAIGAKTFGLNGETQTYLTQDEVENLCIRKGTLTGKERKIIENHASTTGRMLSELPFPKKYAKVPEYAAGHHEKLDGTGYPHGLQGDDLPMQARIMAVADIFEALTARDRPYKKPMPLSQAVKILGFMKKDRHIDPDVHDLFLSSRLFEEYAKHELDPTQLDEVIINPDLKLRRVLVAAQGEVAQELKETLESWGGTVEMAQTAEEAGTMLLRAFYDCKPYRVAFVDASLEDAEGMGIVSACSAIEGFPLYSVILLSNQSATQGGGVSGTAGGCASLPLPLDETALRESVFSIMDQHTYREGVNPALCLVNTARRRMRTCGGKTILVVEDSANARMLYQYYFRGTNVSVDFADNGRAGVEAYTTNLYDLVIMGTRLPVMDGFAAAKSIRQWEKESGTKPVPLIAVTLPYIPQDVKQSLEAGFSDTFERPISKPKLLGLVEHYIAD